MKIGIDTFEEIAATLTRNKTRSLLTAFGVFWGIFMLVTLMGGGKGLQALLQDNFKGFAQNSGFFFPQPTGEAYKGFRKGRMWNLTLDDVTRTSKIEGVDVATAAQTSWGGSAVSGDKKSSVSVRGCFPVMAAIESPNVKFGRFINKIDVESKRKVCFIGNKVSNELFGSGTNPCGRYIRVDGVYYKVVGISAASSGTVSLSGGDASSSVSIPFSTYAAVYNTGDNAGLLCITAKRGYKVSELQPRIELMLKKHHLIHPADRQAVTLVNAEAMFSMVDNLFSGLDVLIWMVGLGTLLAGAIGVSNIMMVTVRERTTEIGIRRAIGATPRAVMAQIMAESLMLTLLAGMAGISFSVLVLQIMDTAMLSSDKPAQFQVDFWAAIGTVAILLALGMLAGLAPAYRAMSVKPIDAMRDE